MNATILRFEVVISYHIFNGAVNKAMQTNLRPVEVTRQTLVVIRACPRTNSLNAPSAQNLPEP